MSHKTSLMTIEHERWNEFCKRLEGPEGCDFKYEPEMKWKCGGGTDKSKARKILQEMNREGYYSDMQWEYIDIAGSLEYFSANGGHCDCEILFNVDSDP